MADSRVDPIVVTARRRRRGWWDTPGFRNGVDVARVGAEGLLDTVGFGVPNLVEALLDTAHDGGTFRQRLAAEAARDEADAKAHPFAHNAGVAAGLATSLLPGLGGVGLLGRAATGLRAMRGLTGAKMLESARGIAGGGRLAAGRLAGSQTGHVLRLGAWSGGAGGLTGQATSDIVSGQMSSPLDYGAAVGGGVVGGLAAPYLGGRGGAAVNGVASSAGQALVNGEIPSLQSPVDSAAQNAAGGGLAARIPEARIARMKARQKGALGENLSVWNARLSGKKVVGRNERRDLPGATARKGYVVPDVITEAGEIESKFGPSARLSKGQIRAMAGERPNFTLEHWLPRDMTDFVANAAAGATADNRVRSRRDRPAR